MTLRIAITDANIFIDLLYLNLVKEFLELPIDVYTTVEVMIELDRDQQELLSRYEKESKLSIEREAEIDESLDYNSGLSPTDRTILSWAFHNDAILISGESKMRTWCKKRNLEYHGILWIFDQLIIAEFLSFSEAIFLLKKLMIDNQWLPIKDCTERIDSWGRNKGVGS